MSEEQGGSQGGEKRHQPKQSRSQETWNSILEAAAGLFAEKGYEQTTTHQIASAAGVSVGALYRYFSDKEAILRELYQREVADVRNEILAAFQVPNIMDQDLGALVRHALATAFAVYGRRSQLTQVLWEQSRKIPALTEQRRSQEQELNRAIASLLGMIPGVRLPDLQLGAYLIRLFIESLIEDQLLQGQREQALDEERVITGATDFLLRYALGRID